MGREQEGEGKKEGQSVEGRKKEQRSLEKHGAAETEKPGAKRQGRGWEVGVLERLR